MQEVADILTRGTCKDTVAGWIWYCDSCDTHGNANSSDEAEYLAKSHAKYYSWIEDDKDEDPALFMEMDTFERDWRGHNWSFECLGATYIIDASENITYSYGDDYTDKTPNRAFDVDKAVWLQKYFGVN